MGLSNLAAAARFNMPGIQFDLPTSGNFGPGFQLQTADSEFAFQFHDLTQFDGRFYTPGRATAPVHSTFVYAPAVVHLQRPTHRVRSSITFALAEGIDNR